MPFIEMLATLLLAHLLADFPLQTDWIYKFKNNHWFGVLLHAMIHVTVTGALLRDRIAAWPYLVILGGLHFACDWTKVRYFGQSSRCVFLIDQAIHVIILIGLTSIMSTMPRLLPDWALYPTLIFAFVPAINVYRLVIKRKKGAFGSHIKIGSTMTDMIEPKQRACVSDEFSATKEVEYAFNDLTQHRQ